MSKSIGRVFGIGSSSPYGYETDYMQYLQGYNPYNYEQTLQNMMPSAVNVNVQPDYQLSVQTTAAPFEKTETADTFSEKPEEADARLRRMLNKIIDNVNQMNAYKESLYQPYNGYGNSISDYNLTPDMQGSDYSLKLPEFDNSLNYTTERGNMMTDVPIFKTDSQNFISEHPNKPNHDVDYYFNRDKDDLCENEGGFIPYAYLDTAEPANTTIGCGINVDQTPDIQLYHAQTEKILSADELQKEIEKLKQLPSGKLHTYYEDKSNIRIAPQENERIMKNKYVDGYNHVTSIYNDFADYNASRQKALMDMIYNLGQPKFDVYQNLKNAILKKDWKRAANEAWRCGVGFGRNKKIVDWIYPGLDVNKMAEEHCKNENKK